MDDNTAPESLEAFRNSFSYGSRSDLNFKFFKMMSDEDAATFLQTLLHHLGDAYDTGDVGPLIEAAYEAQIAGYLPPPGAPPPKFSFDDGPFTAVTTAVANAKVGMLTTSGHFVAGNDPEPFGETDMTQQEATERIGEFLTATPSLSEIPSDTPTSDLRVRHGGYDIRSALRDPNVTFPIDRLREARDDGRVGDLASTFFSFTGATSHGRLHGELPGWVERIHEEGVDVMLLVPVWPVCHVSVGHVARAIEESGVPTVTIMTKAFAGRATEMMIPRSLVVRHPLGRPMGAAHDVERHTEVLDAALSLLESATNAGTVVELPECYRPWPG